MESAKMCGFLAAGCLLLLLLLTMLGDPTEACSCAPYHPQTAYCNSDVVLRGKFGSHSKESEAWNRYEVKITQVYKGPTTMQEVCFLHTPSDSMGSFCEYRHNTESFEDHVITGQLINNQVTITACSFIQPWEQLSPEQRRGLSLDYSKGCSCTIVPCLSMPCSVYTNSSQCLWTDGIVHETWNSIQAKRLACLPRSGAPDLCTWQSLK